MAIRHLTYGAIISPIGRVEQYVPALPPVLGETDYKIISSGTSVTSTTISAYGNGWYIATVMHRSALTTPAGWTLLSTTTAYAGGQFTSMLAKQTTGPETLSVTFATSGSGRLILDLAHIGGDFTPTHLPAKTISLGDSVVMASSKAGANVYVWGMSTYYVSSGAWSAAPAELVSVPDPAPTVDARCGMFYDDVVAGDRTFNVSGQSGTTLDALELVPS